MSDNKYAQIQRLQKYSLLLGFIMFYCFATLNHRGMLKLFLRISLKVYLN